MGRDFPRRPATWPLEVSIHAPLWGATAVLNSVIEIGPRFNPRALVGRDVKSCGATASGVMFQSTRPCGARLAYPCTCLPTCSFNPRALVGRDREECPRRRRCACFNPRALVGRDKARGFQVLEVLRVSIHAPLWGATENPEHEILYQRVSIHAPLWGATPMYIH